MNALKMLKEDHAKVRKLLEELVSTSERAYKRRTDLLEEIEQEIKIHTQLEEEIFYPAFKKASGNENDRMYYEALEEHRAVDELVMPDVNKADPKGTEFSGRAKVLKELITHHADEEEEEMFKQASKTMTDKELEELGEQMAARKKQLLAA